jgi:putative colanic acid biosynthesis UDP-glucose lipid carrier transferase
MPSATSKLSEQAPHPAERELFAATRERSSAVQRGTLTTPGQPRIFRGQLSFLSVARLLLDPLVAVCTLIAVTLAHGEPFRGKYLVLALIVFSLTFPGRLDLSGSPVSIARDIVLRWIPIVILLVMFGYAAEYLRAFPWDVMFEWFLAAPSALLVTHLTLRLALPPLMASYGRHRRAVIAGANEIGLRLADHLQKDRLLGIRFGGFFDDRAAERLKPTEGLRLLGPLANLAAYAQQNRIDTIFIALPMASQPRILKLLDDLRDTTASIYFVPDIFLSDLIQARVDEVNGIPVVAVCETPFYGVSGLVKRIEDVIIATTTLLLVSPLMLAIAAGVKLSSPGPVLFKQRRYGLDGQEILVYKFRSMTVCEDGDLVTQACKGDQRVTAFGAFLRKSSLDELPQFINVLAGSMSIVGPRPHAVAHNEMYRKLIKGYMVRHKVKPGITGWAQVNGLRGETEALNKMKARIEYDLDYLRNWSVSLDLLIILRTVVLIFRDSRAY